MIWFYFMAFVAGLLWLDLKIFASRSDTMKNHVFETLFFVIASILFSGVIWYLNPTNPSESVMEYLSAYTVEKMMSLDNLFVISTIFAFFGVKAEHQHKILFWGIIGVIFFRGALIIGGAALINKFHFLYYFFAGILAFTAYKMLTHTEEEEVDFESKWIVRFLNKHFTVKLTNNGEFWRKDSGKLVITSALVVLFCVEFTDIMFAFDSIPTTLTITKNYFTAFSSNIMAVLGLRALFFIVEDIKNSFAHVEKAIIFILFFIVVKILGEATGLLHISTNVSLIVIFVSVLIGIVASKFFPTTEKA